MNIYKADYVKRYEEELEKVARKDCQKLKLQSKREYRVLTTRELYSMNVGEFISLCKSLLQECPKLQDLIVGYELEAPKDSYLATMFRKSLIQSIQREYVTLELKKLKKDYPSFFKRDV